MQNELIRDELEKAQVACYDAHTDQIVALVTKYYDNNDHMIKMLIDERRRVYREFQVRIDSLQ